MHTRNFYGVDIEEDLGIPLSYDAAWKIFNRWPREVRVQRQRLGQRTTPSKHAWCFCQEKNCTTRCPFFGFYNKKDGPTENKLQSIMSHTQGTGRSPPEYKGLLRSLNKWYNSRCAEGSSQVLDLSKLEQLTVKYKYPVFALNKQNSSRRFRRHDSRSVFYHDTKCKPSSMTSKTTKRNRASEEYSSSELYYTIENQLRNLSVSQSRLKHMSASLCRLAYAKKHASRTGLRPKIYKRKVVRRYRSDIPIVSNSESTGNTNTSKTSNFCRKSSRNSKSTKSTDASKGSKTTESSKPSKDRKIRKRGKSNKSKKSSKSSKPSKGKLSESSKTTGSTKSSKSSKPSKTSKLSDTSKTSKTNKTTESSKTSKTSESSKTSQSYKSVTGSKITSTSKSSESSRAKGASKSEYTSKTGETSKSGAANLCTGTSKRSSTNKSKAPSKNSVSSKSTNVTTAKAISHPVVRSIRFNLAKSKRGATRSAGDEELNSKRKPTGSIIKEQAKVAKPQIQRLGGGNELLNRSNRRPIMAWNSGAGAPSRKPAAETAPKPNSKLAASQLAPKCCLIRKSNKRSIFIDAGGAGDAVAHRAERCRVTKKPSVRISKPILSMFRKKRTISKQSLAMRGQKSRCFFIKGGRRK